MIPQSLDQTIKVMLVDDSQLFIDGLSALLRSEEDIEVVAEAVRKQEVKIVLDEEQIDVLILNLSMLDMSAYELVTNIKIYSPSTKVLALTMYTDQQIIHSFIQVGIAGYVMRSVGKEELLNGIRTIAKGDFFYPQGATRRILNGYGGAFVAKQKPLLSAREIEIVRLIAQEFNNAQIGDKLFISEQTVQTHRKNIFRKTETHTVIGLLKYAYANGLVSA